MREDDTTQVAVVVASSDSTLYVDFELEVEVANLLLHAAWSME